MKICSQTLMCEIRAIPPLTPLGNKYRASLQTSTCWLQTTFITLYFLELKATKETWIAVVLSECKQRWHSGFDRWPLSTVKLESTFLAPLSKPDVQSDLGRNSSLSCIQGGWEWSIFINPLPLHHLPQSDRSLCPVAEKAREMQPHAAGSDVEDHSSGVLQRL